MFGILQHRQSSFITRLQAINGAEHADRKRAARRTGWVTGRARGLIAAAQHRIAGLDNCMVAVTGRATGNTHLREDFAMSAFVEQLGVDRMALTARVRNGRDSGRLRDFQSKPESMKSCRRRRSSNRRRWPGQPLDREL